MAVHLFSAWEGGSQSPGTLLGTFFGLGFGLTTLGRTNLGLGLGLYTICGIGALLDAQPPKTSRKPQKIDSLLNIR
jgi:hypothetical protein